MSRPHISLVPHTFETPPELWVGKVNPVKYQFNQATALLFINTLGQWLQRASNKTEGYCMDGDL